jgi:lipopolysaccharide export system permease protein
VAVSLFVGEYILPDVERVARNDRTRALSDESQITSLFGYWYREGNTYLHFDEIGGGALGGVSHYYFDDNNNLERTLYARRAVFHDVRENEKYWLLERVRITDFKGEATVTRRQPSLKWHSELTPDLLSTEILVQPDKMSISQLGAKIDYMRSQGLNSGKFEIGYWQKVLMPIATVGLVFVAISFIFGPLRESTMGMRVVSGLIVGILFRFIQNLLTPASLVYGFPPLIAIVVPILICLAIGYTLLRRAS